MEKGRRIEGKLGGTRGSNYTKEDRCGMSEKRKWKA